jgi:D-aspartate ligase
MEKIEIQNKVIVFGGSHHNTLGVVRALGEKGIRPYVFISNKSLDDSLVLKSKYVKKGWIYKSEDECLRNIIANFTSDEKKTIIISTSDSVTSLLDLNFDQLTVNFIIPNGGIQGKLTNLMNKVAMNNLARDVGFNIAESWVINNVEEYDRIIFPCITKPLKSISGSKSDIRICYTKDELMKFVDDNNCSDRIMIQRFIEREFEYQLIGCSLKGGEDLLIPGFTKIIRSASDTNTGLLCYMPINSLNFNFKLCKDFIRSINYSGLFSLEFIRGKDGNDYFLEINFRNDGNAYSVTAAGVNLPYIWIISSLNLDYSIEAKREVVPILVMPELVDISQMLSGNITILRWLKDILNTDCFIYFNKKDPIPFFFEIQRLLNVKLKSLIRKLSHRK